MLMQYLYYGGTESMEIPTADILQVRAGHVAQCPPDLISQPRSQIHVAGPVIHMGHDTCVMCKGTSADRTGIRHTSKPSFLDMPVGFSPGASDSG
jgi:hypothetical protein